MSTRRRRKSSVASDVSGQIESQQDGDLYGDIDISQLVGDAISSIHENAQKQKLEKLVPDVKKGERAVLNKERIGKLSQELYRVVHHGSTSKIGKEVGVTSRLADHQTVQVERLLKESPLNGIENKTTAPDVIPKKKKDENRTATAGKQWFDLPATEVTPELKRDIKLIQLRGYLDPKKFYKKEKKEIPKYFHVGTVVEGPTEFYSARMTKKERKEHIVDEILHDSTTRRYAKRKFTEIQAQKISGRKASEKKRMLKKMKPYERVALERKMKKPKK